MEVPHPRPTLDPENRTYWQGCLEHKLLLQYCASCNRLQHPPTPLCPACRSLERSFVEACGRGTVHSYFFARRVVHPAFTPGHNVVLVELEEGVRLVSKLVGCAPEDIAFDMPVVLDFERIDADLVLPVFRKAT